MQKHSLKLDNRVVAESSATAVTFPLASQRAATTTTTVFDGTRYDKLKEDFKFNLGLIEDRDVELGRYEAAVQGLKECLRDKASRKNNYTLRPLERGCLYPKCRCCGCSGRFCFGVVVVVVVSCRWCC